MSAALKICEYRGKHIAACKRKFTAESTIKNS